MSSAHWQATEHHTLTRLQVAWLMARYCGRSRQEMRLSYPTALKSRRTIATMATKLGITLQLSGRRLPPGQPTTQRADFSSNQKRLPLPKSDSTPTLPP